MRKLRELLRFKWKWVDLKNSNGLYDSIKYGSIYNLRYCDHFINVYDANCRLNITVASFGMKKVQLYNSSGFWDLVEFERTLLLTCSRKLNPCKKTSFDFNIQVELTWDLVAHKIRLNLGRWSSECGRYESTLLLRCSGKATCMQKTFSDVSTWVELFLNVVAHEIRLYLRWNCWDVIVWDKLIMNEAIEYVKAAPLSLNDKMRHRKRISYTLASYPWWLYWDRVGRSSSNLDDIFLYTIPVSMSVLESFEQQTQARDSE